MLFKVKVYEPEKASELESPRIDGVFAHPARIRTAIVRQVPNFAFATYPGALMLRPVGGEGSFPFIDNVCDVFWGEYRAEIVGEWTGYPLQSDSFEPWVQ